MKWSDKEEAEVTTLLKGCRTLVLSTANAEGTPFIAPVYFSLGNHLSLDFVSKEDTQHIINLKHRNDVAGAVFREGKSLSDITGLQMRGTILLLKGSEETLARKTYLEHYPELKEIKQLASLFPVLPIFRFTPKWIRMTDHQASGIRRREWKG